MPGFIIEEVVRATGEEIRLINEYSRISAWRLCIQLNVG
jgi:hypothetical protein